MSLQLYFFASACTLGFLLFTYAGNQTSFEYAWKDLNKDIKPWQFFAAKTIAFVLSAAFWPVFWTYFIVKIVNRRNNNFHF